MRQDSRSSSRRDSYRWQTHRPLNCLVFILPMLAFFQVGVFYHGTALAAPQDLGRILQFFGATARYLPSLLIFAVLVLQHVTHRDPLELQPRVLAGMAVESVLWAVPLIVLLQFTGQIAALAAGEGGGEWTVWEKIHLAVGAGIYEEFLFRLMFISLMLLIFVDVFALPKDIVVGAAIILGSVAFSLYHFSLDEITGPDPFPWARFTFYAAAGLYLALLFVVRGFAIAVGAHILYNSYVFFRVS
jgi:hypothetical protein